MSSPLRLLSFVDCMIRPSLLKCITHSSMFLFLYEVVGLFEDVFVADVEFLIDTLHEVVSGFTLLIITFKCIDSKGFVHLFCVYYDGSLDTGLEVLY